MGSGLLLKPIAKQLKRDGSEVICVDADRNALAHAERELVGMEPADIRFVHADFITWSEGQEASFDCVIMNPPFAGRKTDLRQIDCYDFRSEGTYYKRFLPLEAAFVLRSIELLRDRGRLLAILPCSVVMSQSMRWLRDFLLGKGAIRFVHELPPSTFPNVESRMYLMVFDKSIRQRKIVLYNHDLVKPSRLDLWLRNGFQVDRLDFGFHQARFKLQQLLDRTRFSWIPLGDMANVFRGDIESPIGPSFAVHTTDFMDGFWRRSSRHEYSKARQANHTIQRGDVLVKRVGRSCHRSFAFPVALEQMPCSDCVLIVRPKDISTSYSLLFSLQTLAEIDGLKPLIERGTGASYISHQSLLELPIPTNLYACFPRTFASFVAAQRERSAARSRQIVRRAARLLVSTAEI